MKCPKCAKQSLALREQWLYLIDDTGRVNRANYSRRFIQQRVCCIDPTCPYDSTNFTLSHIVEAGNKSDCQIEVHDKPAPAPVPVKVKGGKKGKSKSKSKVAA
jgi:hypothetical protein